jgi:hypothetical protein
MTRPPTEAQRLCRPLFSTPAAAHPWHYAGWPTLGGLLRLALLLGCPASTSHAVNVRSGAVKVFRCLGRPRETGRYGRRERDRQRHWHYEKCGGQECDEKAAGHHFLPDRNEYQSTLSRLQCAATLKTGHCTFQNRPLGVKTGQHRLRQKNICEREQIVYNGPRFEIRGAGEGPAPPGARVCWPRQTRS